MKTQKFSIKNTLKESWSILKGQFGKFVLVSIILSVVSSGLGFLDGQSIVMSLVSFLLQTYIALIWVLIGIRSVEKKKLAFRSTIKEIDFSMFLNFLVLSFLVWLIVIAGTILLVAPGIIFAVALQYAGYYMVDKNLGIRDSIKASWRGTKGSRWKLFLLIIVLFFINILGLLALGVGIFVTIPLSVLMMSHVYVHALRGNVSAS
jgi:uncharacterized membrane protein